MKKYNITNKSHLPNNNETIHEYLDRLKLNESKNKIFNDIFDNTNDLTIIGQSNIINNIIINHHGRINMYSLNYDTNDKLLKYIKIHDTHTKSNRIHITPLNIQKQKTDNDVIKLVNKHDYGNDILIYLDKMIDNSNTYDDIFINTLLNTICSKANKNIYYLTEKNDFNLGYFLYFIINNKLHYISKHESNGMTLYKLNNYENFDITKLPIKGKSVIKCLEIYLKMIEKNPIYQYSNNLFVNYLINEIDTSTNINKKVKILKNIRRIKEIVKKEYNKLFKKYLKIIKNNDKINNNTLEQLSRIDKENNNINRGQYDYIFFAKLINNNNCKILYHTHYHKLNNKEANKKYSLLCGVIEKQNKYTEKPKLIKVDYKKKIDKLLYYNKSKQVYMYYSEKPIKLFLSANNPLLLNDYVDGLFNKYNI